MVEIIKDKNILDTDANIIVHSVNLNSLFADNFSEMLVEAYPHIEIETRKLIRSTKKRSIDLANSVFYIPRDVWALDMVHGGGIFEYDTDYQYIVIAFSVEIDSNTLKGVKNMAKKLSCSVAMPYEESPDVKVLESIFEDEVGCYVYK